MTLFFQNPSIGLILLAFPQILRARRILFYRPYWLSKDWVNPRRKRWAGKLIHWINPRAEVTEHDPEEAFPLAYENNLASDLYMEEFCSRSVETSPSFALLSGLIADPHVDRFYKIRLLPWVLYQTQFYRTARHLNSGEEVCVVPDSLDRHAFHRYFFSEEELRRKVPPAVRRGLLAKNRMGRSLNLLLGINLFLLLGAPLFFLLKTARRAGLRRRAVPVRADVVAPLIWGFLFYTKWGLALRAVGENQAVAFASGYSPAALQYAAVVAGGVMAGIAGAHLSLAYARSWVEGMSNGRGFIAVALVIFATWHPLRGVVGAVVFGAVFALQLQIQARGVALSPYFLDMTPYLLTLAGLLLWGRTRRHAMPEGLKSVFEGVR